jgi:hypothetical protein
VIKALGLEEDAFNNDSFGEAGPDDPGTLYDDYAEDNGLEISYGFDYSGYIIVGKNTKRYGASETPERIPDTLPPIHPDDQRKLNEIAAKLNDKPSWWLVPFYG